MNIKDNILILTRMHIFLKGVFFFKNDFGFITFTVG